MNHPASEIPDAGDDAELPPEEESPDDEQPDEEEADTIDAVAQRLEDTAKDGQ